MDQTADRRVVLDVQAGQESMLLAFFELLGFLNSQRLGLVKFDQRRWVVRLVVPCGSDLVLDKCLYAPMIVSFSLLLYCLFACHLGLHFGIVLELLLYRPARALTWEASKDFTSAASLASHSHVYLLRHQCLGHLVFFRPCFPCVCIVLVVKLDRVRDSFQHFGVGLN